MKVHLLEKERGRREDRVLNVRQEEKREGIRVGVTRAHLILYREGTMGLRGS